MIATNSIVVDIVEKLKQLYRELFIFSKVRRKNVRITKERLERINGGYNGSVKEFDNTVLKYWRKYKMHPEKCWFDLFCAEKDAYDPRFITNSIWLLYVLPHYNHHIAYYWYSDKGMYNRLLKGIKEPETIVKRIGRYYYEGDSDRLISEEEAKKLILQEEHLIIKPSLDTYGGSGIVFYDKDDAEHFDIDSVLGKLNKGFVAQRLVKQHADLSRLNRDSVNTIRVITFHFKERFYVLSTVLRIGNTGARVDNTTAGGYVCPVKSNGWLADKAINRKSEWIEKHESSGIPFKEFRVPSYDRIIENAIYAHSQLPLFDLVGWDFAVDENGVPVMIEYNLQPEQNQISCGPTFGDLTDEVLDDVFLNKTK